MIKKINLPTSLFLTIIYCASHIMENIIITGGAGFIGSHVVDRFLAETDYNLIVVDKLTYASNDHISELCKDNKRVHLIVECIQDRYFLRCLLNEHRPLGVIHLAAESHVDRSISGPRAFIENNICGTFEILEAIRNYKKDTGKDIRLLHVSTDEVFGDLEYGAEKFSESTCYNPSSPYSASKAASDHLVRAWHRTYDIDAIITNCSNNYGPRQHDEKLIPHIISKALKGEALPVYGNGKQIRDWLYVEDHASALLEVYKRGIPGETYCIGGNTELENIEVVNTICDILEVETGLSNMRDLIEYVKDRPGHDKRYAIDIAKIEKVIGWRPRRDFKSGIYNTVQWYLNKY